MAYWICWMRPMAATWNQLSGEEPFHAAGDFKPMIQ
jgi:hypothetical protein